MIRSITFENLKGSSASLKLMPLTIITGENCAGKSTVSDAITLAATGKYPGLPKTNAGVMSLCSRNILRVMMEMGDGTSITREWKQSGTKVTCIKNGEIDERLLPVIQPELFIGADPVERLNMLGTAIGGEPAALASMIPRHIRGETVFDRANAYIDALEADAKEKRAQKTIYTKTLAGIAAMQNAVPAVPPPAEFPDHWLADARSLLAKDIALLESFDDRVNAANDADNELLEMGELGAYDHDTAMREAAELAAVKELISTKWHRRRELATLRTQYLWAMDEPALNIDETREALRLAQAAAVENPEKRQRKVEARMSENQGMARVAMEKEASVRRQIAEIESLAECPTCKASAEGWRENVLSSLKELLSQLSATIGGFDTQRSLDANERDRLMSLAHLAAQEGRLTEALDREARRIGELEKLRHINGEVTRLEADMETLEGEREALVAKLDVYVAGREDRARREKLEQIKANGPDKSVLSAMDASVKSGKEKVAELEARLAEVQDQRRAYADQTLREADMQTARENVETAEKELAEVSAKVEAVKTEMEKSLQALCGELMHVAAFISERVIEKRVSVNAAGEIGAQGDVGWIPFAALSGTEKIVATAALQAALSLKMGGVVILDEISRLSHPLKQRLAGALAEMNGQSGLQVILLDHDRKFGMEVEDAWGYAHIEITSRKSSLL